MAGLAQVARTDYIESTYLAVPFLLDVAAGAHGNFCKGSKLQCFYARRLQTPKPSKITNPTQRFNADLRKPART